MIGTALNVSGILLGGIAGMFMGKPLPPATESALKMALFALTTFCGLWLTWISLNGTPVQILKQLLIAVVAMVLGKLAGRLLRLQALSNRLGHAARERIDAAHPEDRGRLSAGFKTCTVLFCAAPLGILGSVQDGLSGYLYPLAIKAVIDGLATIGFLSLFGRGVLLAALPVLVFQGSITLLCAQLVPFLQSHGAHGLVDSINAVGGLLVFSVALVILGLKRIELADYLPSLMFAPLITWILG